MKDKSSAADFKRPHYPQSKGERQNLVVASSQWLESLLECSSVCGAASPRSAGGGKPESEEKPGQSARG